MLETCRHLIKKKFQFKQGAIFCVCNIELRLLSVSHFLKETTCTLEIPGKYTSSNKNLRVLISEEL